jgi:hypothetical protein
MLVMAGCSGEHRRVTAPIPPSIPSLTLDELLGAPDSLRVEGTTLSTDIFVWRAYDVNTSTGIITAVYLNGSPLGTLPSSVGDVYVWLIRGSEVWSKTMTFKWLEAGRSNAYEFMTEDGPRWDTGILIDVVIGARTSPTSVSLVRLRNVLLHKVS